MPRNTSGNYSLPAGNPVIGGTKIQSTWANTTLNDLATEMTNSLDRQGRAAMSAPLKLADGTVSAPGITFNSDPNCGFYRANPDEWSGAAGGVEVIKFTVDGVEIIGSALTIGGVEFTPADWAKLTGAAFTGDLSTTGNLNVTGTGTTTITTPTGITLVNGAVTRKLTPRICSWAMSLQSTFSAGSDVLAFDFTAAGGTVGYNSGDVAETTGVFTVPVTGLYSLSAMARMSNAADTLIGVLEIQRNGTSYFTLTNGLRADGRAPAAGATVTLNVSVMIPLNAADVVSLKMNGGAVSGSTTATVSWYGFLLQEV